MDRRHCRANKECF